MGVRAVQRLLLLVGLMLAATPALGQETDSSSSDANYTRAMHLFYAGNYEEALPLFVRERDLARSQFGGGSGEHATALNNLGEVYRQLGRLDEAEAEFVAALEIEEARLGDDDPWLAKPLNNLALVYRAQGRYDDAEQKLKRSLRILEESLGHRHPDVAGSLNNLARLYETTGHPERAEPLLQRALMIARNTLGDAHPTTQHVQANLQRISVELGADAAQVAPTESASSNAVTAAVNPAVPKARPASRSERAVTTQESRYVVAAPLPPPAALSEPLPPPATLTAEPAPAQEEHEEDGDSSTVEVAAVPQATEEGVSPEPGSAANGPTALSATDEAAVDDATSELVPLPAARPPGWRWPRLPTGRFAIHLASVRDPVSATEEWWRLREELALGTNIDQLEPQRIEVAGEGVFYRVVGGPFATQDDAEAACDPVLHRDAFCRVVGNAD